MATTPPRHSSKALPHFKIGNSAVAAPVFTPADQLVVPEDLLASNAKELENDPHKVEVRMKQVQYGKNTIGYDNYLAAVPKEKRSLRPEHPVTPDIYEKISKRHFDGRIKAWRRALHTWDTMDERPDAKPRQKRTADMMDGGDTAVVDIGSKKDDRAKTMHIKKRQKVEETSPSPTVVSHMVQNSVDELPEPKFATGEEIDDGYISEDVL